METLRIGPGVPARAPRGGILHQLQVSVLIVAAVVVAPIAALLAISEAVLR